MGTTARKFFIITAALAILVWVSMGYLFVRQRYPNFLTSTPAPASPQFTTLTDSEYGFSFSYPDDLNLQQSSKDTEQLAIESPTYHPTVKKYMLLQDPQTPAMEVFVVEGNFSQKLDQLETSIQSSTIKPTQEQIKVANGESLLLVEAPAPGGSTLTYGYYQLSADHYLQIVVPPEFSPAENRQLIIRQMLQTLSSKGNHVET